MRNCRISLFVPLYFIWISLNVSGQVDVEHYDLHITVNDDNDSIKAEARIILNCEQEIIVLDLASINTDGKGMKVKSVHVNGHKLKSKHENDLLTIPIKGLPRTASGSFQVYIQYEGIPADGLIIGKNKFGSRTFFGDNWPNRAHNWFPCHDHPSDKATFNYELNYPDHYTCVANGKNEYSISSEGMTNSVFSSEHPLPTKVMVFGLADFSSFPIDTPIDMSHMGYVYKENETEGKTDMAVAANPLKFYIENIGPYPFEKLDNVQSTTRFGGMENAGCIFYDEDAITGRGTMENLIAHEIAHQWFGNSATESDWQHLWLSEGFATYFTNLYLESKYGEEKMNDQLRSDRSRVIAFAKKYHTPVVDTVSEDLMYLLNPNSYQKGGWILHMLRQEVGDELFWEAIRAYYHKFAYGNASSDDLIRTFETVCERNLTLFFDQWLKRSDHPILKAELSNGIFRIVQMQDGEPYHLKLQVKFTTGKGNTPLYKTFEISKKTEEFDLSSFELNKHFVLDPGTKLLFEAFQPE